MFTPVIIPILNILIMCSGTQTTVINLLQRNENFMVVVEML